MILFNCMMNRLKLYTHHLAVRFNEDFSMPLSCKKFVADMLQKLQNVAVCGALAELVYALVLGTSIFGYESSSLLRPTKTRKFFTFNISQISYQQNCNRVVRRWTLPLGSSAVRCEGSSPFRPTIRFDEL